MESNLLGSKILVYLFFAAFIVKIECNFLQEKQSLIYDCSAISKSENKDFDLR